jgi:hypothetical protein
MTEKECASIITKGRVPDGLSGPGQRRDPSLGAARDRLASLPQDVKRDGFPGSYREPWRLGSDRNSVRGQNLVFALTQGLRPGLSYAAPPGLELGCCWLWCAGGGWLDGAAELRSAGQPGDGCVHVATHEYSRESAEILRWEPVARERLRCLRMTWVLAGGIRS